MHFTCNFKLMEHIPAVFLVSVMAFYAYKSKATTGPAAVTGFFVAMSIYAGGRWTGLLLLLVFFTIGTFVSKWRWEEKTLLKVGQENSGTRKIANVLGNGLAPALAGLLAFLIPQHAHVLSIMLAGSIATATSDTFSSELGNIYGKAFYDVLTFKPGTRGNDGVVSPAGSLWGVAGALIIATIFFLFSGIAGAVTVFLSGLAGNLLDSVLGATLQRKKMLNNHQVNFASGLAGALIAGGLYFLFTTVNILPQF